MHHIREFDMATAIKNTEMEEGGLSFDLRPESYVNIEGREILRPDKKTGVTVLPAWMDSAEDDGLYDDLV